MFSLTLSYKIHENINAASMFMMLGVVYDAINRAGSLIYPQHLSITGFWPDSRYLIN